MSSSRKFQVGAFIILLFHTVGLIGMNVGVYVSLFESVAWANILLSFGLMAWCHEYTDEPQKRESAKEIDTSPKSPSGGVGVSLFIALTCILGFLAEVTGVKTGLIFGAYHYTSVFGWSLLSVPLIIGINWSLLTYASGVSVSKLLISPITKIIAGAALMTACDLLLEGFAIKHHFWVWDITGLPPIQNFIGWFLVSLILQGIYQLCIPQSRNKLAGFYLLGFVAFLMVDRFILA